MAEDNSRAFKAYFENCANVLNPLFDTAAFMNSERLFEFVCTMVRASGVQDARWDAWDESRELLRDLGNLSKIVLPEQLFPNAERTRVRLSLLSYCHITEMDLPYELIANLLRLRLGEKYDTNPFRDLFDARGKNRRVIRPSPLKKIGRINDLSKRASLAEVGQKIESIHDTVIRNAAYHSDYTLADGEFRLLKDFHLSSKTRVASQAISFEELNDFFMHAFAFYTALFLLFERCKKSLSDFDGAIIPYDDHYKGLLQLLIDQQRGLIGFRTFWPNGTTGEFCRTEQGCSAVNVTFDPDGSVNFMVGRYATTPGQFSPLVEHNESPNYQPLPGTTTRPYWPTDLKPYKIL